MNNKLIIAITLVTLQLISLVSAITIESVKSNPEEVEPGKNVKITLDLENNLGKDVEDVIISLDLAGLPIAPYKAGSDQTIEKLDDGDDESVDFSLIVLPDADSSTYKIPVEIGYTLNDNREAKKSFISLIINAAPELDISYEGSLIKGKNNAFNIKIINSGLGEVKLLKVSIQESSGLKILNSKEVYIGDLDSDDFDIAEFEVFIDSSTSSTISLPVKLLYRDSANNVKEEMKNILLRVYSTEEALQLGLITKNYVWVYVVIVIVLIAGYFVYRRLKKRWKNKKKEGR